MQRAWLSAWHVVGTQEVADIFIMCCGLVTDCASGFPIYDSRTNWKQTGLDLTGQQDTWQFHRPVEQRPAPVTPQRDRLT